MKLVKRRAVIGLAGLCALAFSVVTASDAAAVPTASNTASTCVETTAGTGEFADAHCGTKGGTKSWKHVGIPVGESTQLTLAATSTWEFIAPIGGPEFNAYSSNVECLECMVENHEEEVKGKKWMDVQGTGKLRFTGVVPPVELTNAGCFPANKGVVTTPPLKFTTTSAGKLLVEPVSGVNLFTLEWLPGCPVVNLLWTGHFNGTLTGATLKVETVAGEVDFGASGHVGYLRAGATLSAGVTGKETMNPLSFTAS
jgi:hypothetical protein